MLNTTVTKKTLIHNSRLKTVTKWPEDKVTATRLDEKGWLNPDAAREKFILVCGLIARERVSINIKVEDLILEEKRELFTVLEEKARVSTQPIYPQLIAIRQLSQL